MARSDACRLKNTFNVEKMWDVHLFKRVCEEFTSLRGSDHCEQAGLDQHTAWQAAGIS